MKLRYGINLALFLIISSIFYFSCAENDVMEDLVIGKDQEYLSLSLSDRILVDAGAVWIDKLCSRDFEGRKSGTEGNRLAFEYICHELEEMGYVPECQIFNTEKGTTIRNIIVTIPGKIDSTVIVGAHFDGPIQSTGSDHYPAAEDNGSGAVALMLLLKSLKVDSIEFERTLICGLWDSEEVLDGKAFRGSTYYAKHMSEQSISNTLFYINFDCVGHDHDYDHNGKSDIYLEYRGSDLVEKIAYLTSQTGRFDYNIAERETFTSDYTFFYRIGIPFLYYHDHNNYICSHPNHSTKDTQDAISIERLVRITHCVRDNLYFLL